jgi:hypothetical protein
VLLCGKSFVLLYNAVLFTQLIGVFRSWGKILGSVKREVTRLEEIT